MAVSLASDAHGLRIEDNGVVAEFTLDEGQSALFVLRLVKDGSGFEPVPSPQEAEDRFRQTTKFWRDWLSKCTYRLRLFGQNFHIHVDNRRQFVEPEQHVKPLQAAQQHKREAKRTAS